MTHFKNYCESCHKGELKIFSGKNCVNNPVTGKICDFEYLTSVSGLSQPGLTYQVALNTKIDLQNDQILMTYRSADEAIFAGMRISIDLGGAFMVKDILSMEGFRERVIL